MAKCPRIYDCDVREDEYEAILTRSLKVTKSHKRSYKGIQDQSQWGKTRPDTAVQCHNMPQKITIHRNIFCSLPLKAFANFWFFFRNTFVPFKMIWRRQYNKESFFYDLWLLLLVKNVKKFNLAQNDTILGICNRPNMQWKEESTS